MSLRLVPPDGRGPEADPTPSGPRPATDAEALGDRVTLGRLASRLVFLGTPGDWVSKAVSVDDGVLVAVFDADAMPELAGLLLRGRS